MSVVKIKARLIAGLHAALVGNPQSPQGILKLSPPPTVKGRYALAKAVLALEPHVKLLVQQTTELAKRHAVTDAAGVPVVKHEEGRSSYRLKDAAAYRNEYEAMIEEEIELHGVRQITHAELGDCPITAEQESLLLLAGLLEDKEPE